MPYNHPENSQSQESMDVEVSCRILTIALRTVLWALRAASRQPLQCMLGVGIFCTEDHHANWEVLGSKGRPAASSAHRTTHVTPCTFGLIL